MDQIVEQLLTRFPGSSAAWEPECCTIEVAGAEVTVVIALDEMDLRLQTIRWEGPHTPVPDTRRWKNAKLAGKSTEDLAELVRAACEARRKEYRICRYCKESVPPEHRISRNVCHGCAERYLGVVF